MRIVATSDTHGHLPTDIPKGDVFIHAGDFSPVTDHKREAQREFLMGPMDDWLRFDIPCPERIVIAGNHDFIGRRDANLLEKGLFTYLNNTSCEVDQTKFWGSPYSVEFGGWAFMQKDEQLAEIWAKIPDDTNVLIVHGPPYGYGDKCLYHEGRDPHQGSRSLTKRLEELDQMKLVICGHIHESAGVYDGPHCPIANVSYLNLDYRPRGYIYTFDI